ncbi:hypothetical protein PV416_05090 [Streptomyces ipomoeae]|uniref:hypothetical protein n=1 Tax=Streptomyces ipomoeae TaxID=103232 RepID=UPI0029A8B04D|nr:hypothetical protein [Streptomyces ipomoeae]MDX2820475.1 hypothetical protein [Streptomyces ipomoeae]MDX2874815.1 hypothetical protein [Streptomyces ipomoeae]
MTSNIPGPQVAFETHAQACTFPVGRPPQAAAVAYEIRTLATAFRAAGIPDGLDTTLADLGWLTAAELGSTARPLPGWAAYHTAGQLTVTMPNGTWYTGPLPLDDAPEWLALARSRNFILNVAGPGVMTAGHGFFMDAERVRYTATPFSG